jgi:pectate lyase
VHRCYFDQTGSNSIFINNHNSHITVDRNIFSGSGESAVAVVGDRFTSLGTHSTFPTDITVSNNTMFELGHFGKQVAGVFVSNAQRVTISHNR